VQNLNAMAKNEVTVLTKTCPLLIGVCN